MPDGKSVKIELDDLLEREKAERPPDGEPKGEEIGEASAEISASGEEKGEGEEISFDDARIAKFVEAMKNDSPSVYAEAVRREFERVLLEAVEEFVEKDVLPVFDEESGSFRRFLHSTKKAEALLKKGDAEAAAISSEDIRFAVLESNNFLSAVLRELEKSLDEPIAAALANIREKFDASGAALDVEDIFDLEI